MAPSIRPARPDDAPHFARIHVRCWQAAYQGLIPDEVLQAQSVPRRLELWTRLLGQPEPGFHAFAAVDDGVRGFCAVGPGRDLPELGELYAVYLDPQHIGRGLGRALIVEGMAALARDHDQAFLWVLEGNRRARQVYEAAGWAHDGGEKFEDFGEQRLRELRYRVTLG